MQNIEGKPANPTGKAGCVSGPTTGIQMQLSRIQVFALCSLVLSSCIPDPVIAVFEPGDLRPPAVVTWGATGPAELLVVFDEAVRADAGAFDVAWRSTGLEINAGIVADGGFGETSNTEVLKISSVAVGPATGSVVVVLADNQMPGLAYVVTGLVSDSAGNSSSFVLPYWGYNADPAGLVINELLTEGSSTRPDALELFVHEAGNLAGLTLFIGSPGLHDLRYVFPACAVDQGEFLILHLKPQGLPEELDELEDLALSGGLDASAVARDFWVRGEPGSLSGKNGVVTLCVSPTGAIMDAVAYSERTSESDTKYDGFGTAAFRDRVGEIVASEAWAIMGAKPAPEDCARSTGTTSTRTICRSSQSVDSDSGPDWHIVPTKGISLGTANSDEVYLP